jgi:hypothetical protein
MARNANKPSEVKPKPVDIDPDSRPILEELVKTYGTYKNTVAQALKCLHRQMHEQQQPHNAANGS